MAVEGLDGSRPRILRYEIANEGVVRRCGDLRGGGELIQQPFTLAWLDAGHVAVSGWDVLQVIEPTEDRELWQLDAPGSRAVDLARVRLPGGDALAVAWTNSAGGTDIRTVRFHGFDSPAEPIPQLEANSGSNPFGLGVYSIAQSPIRPERLLFLKPIDYAAAEYDVTMRMRVMPSYAPSREGLVLRSLHALDDGTSNRLVWAGAENGTEGVFYVSEPTGSAPQPPSMPRSCTSLTCASFPHAVPDPTHPHRIYAICDAPTFEDAKLVRLSVIDQSCEVIVEAPELEEGGRARMSRLSIARVWP